MWFTHGKVGGNSSSVVCGIDHVPIVGTKKYGTPYMPVFLYQVLPRCTPQRVQLRCGNPASQE